MNASEPLTADEARRRAGFSLYRKTARTLISDHAFPPGTVYATPEGLRAEDEDTRAALDVQGGIYPIRESVFLASYALDNAPDALRDALDQIANKMQAAAYHRNWRQACIDANEIALTALAETPR